MCARRTAFTPRVAQGVRRSTIQSVRNALLDSAEGLEEQEREHRDDDHRGGDPVAARWRLRLDLVESAARAAEGLDGLEGCRASDQDRGAGLRGLPGARRVRTEPVDTSPGVAIEERPLLFADIPPSAP